MPPSRDSARHELAADQLGTPVVQLNASGTPELLQLKLPYGAGRYAAASLANLGFTGQRMPATQRTLQAPELLQPAK